MNHTPDPETPITTDTILRALRTTGHIDIPDPDGTGDLYRIDVDLFRINGETNEARFINLDELEIILRARDNTRPQGGPVSSIAQILAAEYPMSTAAAERLADTLTAAGLVHHDTLPQIVCECGRTTYIPAADPDTVRGQRAVARWALLEVAEHVDACSRAHDPGALIRDWADANYPDDK